MSVESRLFENNIDGDDMERNVICMKWGTKFGPEYANRLYKMVQKNLTLPHRFVCFTDDPTGLDAGIEVRELPPYHDNPNIGDKGWRKLSLFNAPLADLQGVALFLDLDIVIRRNIDELFEVPGDFLICKDWDFPRDIIGNSSVFRFDVGKYPEVLENFYKLGNEIRKDYRNEQAFLSYQMHEKGILKYWDKSWCVSFKRHCLRPFPLNFFLQPVDPEDVKIIVFHGKPTPQMALKGYCGKKGFRYVKPTTWLTKYWTE